MNNEQRTNAYREYIQAYLKQWYKQFHGEPQKALFDAMEYSLLADGKRLRPILVFEFCRLCCGDWEKAVPFAAALEMIHTYSLIHDDLPCMDNDDFRRGRPTNHKVYGEALALLAGDALLTDAFAILTSANLEPAAIAEATAMLAQCAGSMGMVGGQVLDIMSEDRQLTEDEVIDIQSRKTGMLLVAACSLGAIAGGANGEQAEAASKFAAALGMAFQIRDDMLDVIGTQDEMGKSVGTDAQKNTFVRLFGLEACEEYVQQFTDFAIDCLSVFEDSEYLTELSKSLVSRRN